MKKASVIGGGIVGLCCAYYLAKEGHQVVVFDKSDMADGCSYGNAGMIVPSHIFPLAQPGMISQGINWMFDSQSPFYIKPRLSLDLLKWGFKFYTFANNRHVEKAIPALYNLSILSKDLYQEIAQNKQTFSFEEKGLLMLYRTHKVADEMYHEGKKAASIGLEVDFLTKEKVSQFEIGTKTDVMGAIHYRGDSHLYPQKFMTFIKSELLSLGVEIKSNILVQDVKMNSNKISEIITEKGRYTADEVVLATGAWSPELARKMQIDISILPGKGYSFTLENPVERPTIPTILCEGKVAVTPMGADIRYGGTMEITHTQDTKINRNRLQGIVNTINQFYPDLQIKLPNEKDVWYGFRPCTPSGMPIIAKSRKISNLTIATGHAMMGLSLAPATGKIVSELISEKPSSVNIEMFKI